MIPENENSNVSNKVWKPVRDYEMNDWKCRQFQIQPADQHLFDHITPLVQAYEPYRDRVNREEYNSQTGQSLPPPSRPLPIKNLTRIVGEEKEVTRTNRDGVEYQTKNQYIGLKLSVDITFTRYDDGTWHPALNDQLRFALPDKFNGAEFNNIFDKFNFDLQDQAIANVDRRKQKQQERFKQKNAEDTKQDDESNAGDIGDGRVGRSNTPEHQGNFKQFAVDRENQSGKSKKPDRSRSRFGEKGGKHQSPDKHLPVSGSHGGVAASRFGQNKGKEVVRKVGGGSGHKTASLQ